MFSYNTFLSLSPLHLEKLITSLIILLLLSICKVVMNFLIKKKVSDAMRAHRYRRIILYLYSLLLLLFIGRIWIQGIDSLTTFLGLATAGFAISMHETIANLAGWVFIIWRKPFRLGDRIEINGTAGDVIDIRIFQFSVIEIGNWVDADQSTGRIIHIPNGMVLRKPLANSHIGFEYIWNEIPVLITFESNWKKAKKILTDIAAEKTEFLSAGAQEQIRRAAEKYLIFYENLTPIIYTTVKDSGVLLTVRYLVDPRKRRVSEEHVWEAVLESFAVEPDVELAYPTIRYYTEKPPSVP